MNLLDFGAYVRGLRIRTRKSLKTLCQDNALDVRLCSRIERGLSMVPNRAWLMQYAAALGLAQHTSEWQDFVVKAEQHIEDVEVVAKPVFVREQSV